MSAIFTAGHQLGRYRIQRLLGSGAMGDVYLAEDPQIERQLALKTVRVAEAKQDELEDRKRRLLREAKAAGKLIHPHVVTLFDAGEAEGVLYLAFEFVGGSDLARRLDEAAVAPLTLGEVLRIARQAAEALDFAHRQGIVHRDIKPSNILLDEHGRVKVADFGIAKVVGQSTELTMTGSVVGSPHYLSPEQVRGEELDGRSDIFSLGIVLYELLGHQRPFQGESLTTLVYQILHQEPPPIPSLRPDLAPRLEQLVRRMIAKQRDDRFATAGELAAEIAAVERELGSEALALPATVDAAAARAHPAAGRHRRAGLGERRPARRAYRGPARRATVTRPPTAAAAASPPAPAVPAVAPAAVRRRSPLPWILAGLAVFVIVVGAAGWFLLRPLLRSMTGRAEAPAQATVEAAPATPATSVQPPPAAPAERAVPEAPPAAAPTSEPQPAPAQAEEVGEPEPGAGAAGAAGGGCRTSARRAADPAGPRPRAPSPRRRRPCEARRRLPAPAPAGASPAGDAAPAPRSAGRGTGGRGRGARRAS